MSGEPSNAAGLALSRSIVDYRFALAAAGRRDTTVSWYADILAAFVRFATADLGHAPRLGEFELGLARRYAVSLNGSGESAGRGRARPLRRASVRGHLKALKAFGRWLAREGYLAADPLAALQVPRDDDRLFAVFGDAELRALFRAADGEDLAARRLSAILWLLLDTGLRLAELVGLTLDAVDLETGSARVLGKGGRERLVPLGAATTYALRRYLEMRRGPASGSLFLGTSGRPWSARAVYQAIRALGRRAEISGVRCSPHTFRHTFATRYLTLGGDLLTLQRLLGHSPRSLDVTRRYVNLVDADLRAAHRRHSPGDDLARSGVARIGAVRPPRAPVPRRTSLTAGRTVAGKRRAGRPGTRAGGPA